jgi:hypothetical protein
VVSKRERPVLKLDKIIGFTISKNQIDHSDIDVFHRDLTLHEMEHGGFHIYIWGIHDIEKCKINGKYSLSFPLSENLLDKNILLYFEGGNVIIENDWLGSTPVFYNESDGIVSTLSLKTLTRNEIHPEGLADYIEFGYSAFEQTPFKHVRFMRYYSKLIFNPDGISIECKEDPVYQKGIFDKTEDERRIFENIQNYINNVETMTCDEIILPTSGGFDSRLLNLCINDKSRIRAFTYGISDNQSESSEVVHAKKISEILGTTWEQVELGEYNKYIEDWFKIFGISTHLHGMYHIEFYKKILEKHSFGENATFLSGIIGDAFSGNVLIATVKNYHDVKNLSYSHGANADVSQLVISYDQSHKQEYFKENRKYFDNEKIRIIQSMRMKIVLLSYLRTIPEYFGFPVWTPFHNFGIAIGMLNLPKERRKNRVWQQDIFKKHNLDVENMGLSKDNSNTQDYQAFINHEFEPLDINVLSPYFKKDYLLGINNTMLKTHRNLPESIISLHDKILQIRYIGPGLCLMGCKQKKDILIPMPYFILKALELGLFYRQTAVFRDKNEG